jgi:hypothetical protein
VSPRSGSCAAVSVALHLTTPGVVGERSCVANCRGAYSGPGYPAPPGLLRGQPDPLIDSCGVCGGSGKECADCRGTPNGNATLDRCGRCNEDPSDDCIPDCTGRWRLPPAAADPLLDACGVCRGDNSSCLDCAGEPNGGAALDMCRACDTDPSNDCPRDCAGVWGGLLELDACDVCG